MYNSDDYYDVNIATSKIYDSVNNKLDSIAWFELGVTDIIKDYLSGNAVNRGIMINTWPNAGNLGGYWYIADYYASAEYKDIQYRPKLTIVYNTDGTNTKSTNKMPADKLSISCSNNCFNVLIPDNFICSTKTKISLYNLKGTLISEIANRVFLKGKYTISLSNYSSPSFYILVIENKNILKIVKNGTGAI